MLKDRLTFRKKTRSSNRLSLMVTIVGATLALALGLTLRQTLVERVAQAEDVIQAEKAPILPPSDNSVEAINSAAQVVPQSQSANGITVTATNFRKEGGQVNVDVCFTMPDDGDWSIWSATLKAGELEISELWLNPIEGGEPNAGLRCDTLTFEVPSNAKAPVFTLHIGTIGAYPREGEVCTTYLEKVRKALVARNLGIQVGCQQEDWGEGLEVISKPASMSMEEAKQIIHSTEFFTLPGPWVFTFTPHE